MAKVYPKLLRFLLADAVREESGGKLTILGLYSGDQLVLQGPLPKAVPKGFKGMALPGLTVLVMISDGHGEFECRFQIFDPNDALLGDGKALILVNKQKDVASNLLFPITPFPITAFGRYRVLCKLDGRSYEYAFQIRHQNAKARLPRLSTRTESDQSAPSSSRRSLTSTKGAASRPRKKSTSKPKKPPLK